MIEQWVHHTGSLMDHLRLKAQSVHLRVLSHQFDNVVDWEISTLNLPPQTRVLRREILMMADQTHPCWYAKTIIPEETYETKKMLFDQLSQKPLGDLIWKEPDIQRKNIQYQLPVFDHPFANADNPNRLSTIAIQDRYLFYLLEVFLPDLVHYSYE